MSRRVCLELMIMSNWNSTEKVVRRQKYFYQQNISLIIRMILFFLRLVWKYSRNVSELCGSKNWSDLKKIFISISFFVKHTLNKWWLMSVRVVKSAISSCGAFVRRTLVQGHAIVIFVSFFHYKKNYRYEIRNY